MRTGTLPKKWHGISPLPSKNPHAKALYALETKDILRETLRGALFHSFLHAGYDREESVKLTDIAIGPVHSAMQQANYAYKLHLEAALATLPPKTVIIDFEKEANKVP